MDPPRPGDLKIAGLADRTSSLVGWTIAWRATSAVATLALGAVLVRQLPTSEYGRYTLVLSVLVYIALLATFGQDQGLLRYLPEIVGRGDRAAAHDLLRKSAIAVVAVWALTSVFVFALRPVIDGVLHAQVADLLALGTVLLLGGIAAGVLSFALVAIYDMRSQAFATPIAGALTLALAVLFLRRGGHLGSVLLAGAIGQSTLAAFYLWVLLRRIRRAEGIAGDRVGWRRLLVYASGWLPSLLIASAVGLQFESLFLLRFSGPTTVAFYDTGYNIPQRLVALIQRFGLWGAVAAVGLTTGLTIALSFAAWHWVDGSSLRIPWGYGIRCLAASAPYGLIYLVALVTPHLRSSLRLPLLLVAAALATLVWSYLVRAF